MKKLDESRYDEIVGSFPQDLCLGFDDLLHTTNDIIVFYLNDENGEVGAYLLYNRMDKYIEYIGSRVKGLGKDLMEKFLLNINFPIAIDVVSSKLVVYYQQFGFAISDLDYYDEPLTTYEIDEDHTVHMARFNS